VPDLTRFGDEAVSDEIQQLVVNAENQQPYVKLHDVWGKRYDYDKLITSHGWKELGKWGARNGVIALGYESNYGNYRRIVQHVTNYIFSASSGLTSCPTSMSSGAARLLTIQVAKDKLPPSHPFHHALQRVISRNDDRWVSSQWMTERPGGSDVQNTETVATYSPLASKSSEHGRIDEGDYLINGFKFFSSATDAHIAFILAKTSSGILSLFVAPLRKTILDSTGRQKQTTNGVRIHRLKSKMGTKSLPTAELSLKDCRAHLVGPLDRGIATVADLLNVSRSHNFITSASLWRRSMAIAKSFAKARTSIDQPLWLFPMHLSMLADMEVKHRGLMHLNFFTTALISFAENGFPEGTSAKGYAPLPREGEEVLVVLRTLTATAKAVVCKVSLWGIQECQEAMGGVGYMDEPDEPEFNVSRLYRDAAANVIWEGTTNVLASETVRHLLAKENLGVFDRWVRTAMGEVEDVELNKALNASWDVLLQRLTTGKEDLTAVLGQGRQLMFSLAWVVSGMLLAHDAQRDGNAGAKEVARRWILHGEGGVGDFVLADVVAAARSHAKEMRLQHRAEWDCRLVWDMDLPENSAAGYRGAVRVSLDPSRDSS
jgi:alkylation response protein AidB-like acyl-CoA dehydrogenase